LEKAGFAPTIIEATDRVGGRVKSDRESGIPLDHGFQVLLSAYPEARKYLDYDRLDLVRFRPGSIIYKNGKQQKIGDPRRDISFLWPTLSAGIGSIRDKLLILKLSNKLKKKSLEAIFSSPEVSTLDYLRNFGFSEKVIENFFQPFFAGIYLEEHLETSSRMFEFVYKMFGTGYATIPRNGMQAIPEQLAAQLAKTEIRFNTRVIKIENKTLHLEHGEKIEADPVIIATDPDPFMGAGKKKETKWKSCYNLYLETESPGFDQAIIGLLPNKELLVNNFHFLGDVFGGTQEILSVTVVKSHSLTEDEMVERVKKELEQYCHIRTKGLVRLFHIKKALPDLSQLKYEPAVDELLIRPGIYCCGDHLANGSLNAAMASGRLVAEQIVRSGK
jgi:protoporphyrinogen oxidase